PAKDLDSRAVGPDIETHAQVVGDEDPRQGITDEELTAGPGLELEAFRELAAMGGSLRPLVRLQVNGCIRVLALPGWLGRLEPVVQDLGLRRGPSLLAPHEHQAPNHHSCGNHDRDEAARHAHGLETSLSTNRLGYGPGWRIRPIV